MPDDTIATVPVGWTRTSSHSIAWGRFRIAKASVCGETVYTLFEMAKRIQSRELVEFPEIRGVSRDLAALKREAETFDLVHWPRIVREESAA